MPRDGGQALHRVPESVRSQLNDGAQRRYTQTAGIEIRFQTESPTVEVTFSAASPTQLVPYWGPCSAKTTYEIGTEPTTVELTKPPDLRGLPRSELGSAFGPDCWRLRFRPLEGPIVYHDCTADTGEIAPPSPGETPASTYLAYGTSITQGDHATGPHLTYPAQAARRLGVDHLNFGTAGSAYCEAAIAEYMAGLEWDIATLALSVNMTGEFTPAEFRSRSRFMIRTMADTGRQLAVVTLLPHTRDICPDVDAQPATDYRATLRSVVAELDRPNVTVLEGPDLLEPPGLTGDLLHPSDHGMIRIGEGLAAALAPLL